MTEPHHMSSTTEVPRNAIAIVGMAGRFPDAPDLGAFWRNLTNGVESLAPVTDDELLAIGVPPEAIADPAYVKKCTYVDGVENFDASFFGFNAREAEILDPQQRVFLECAWEAIEDAGYVGDRYPGAIGVFAGASMNTYVFANLLANPAALETVGGYQAMISNDKDFLATRVSYKLNLRGPGITVQTACSTSLVAVQLAWQSLINGQCDMALAGGVSVGFPQKVGYLYREGMIFSPDGHCRPFDARGQGIRAGSGSGVVVLKRLADAMADGDHIRAVVLGAAINNDGAGKMGYTAPSIDGQAAVISMAQASAGVDPDTISYVEAHGTATPLGDPIEVDALSQVFSAGTDRRHFCALGSVKSNIGHLDAAAGVAGLVKTVLSLEHRLLPPSLNFERPNPQIDFANSPFYVNASLAEWTGNGHPRRAGVSSFGIGGTNAHVVLQEAPERPASTVDRPAQLLLLSARSVAALEAAASNLAEHLAAHPQQELGDVAYTLQVGRKRFEHRRAVVCHDTSSAVAALSRSHSAKATAAGPSGNPAIAFMFSGQGSQYAGMGRGLYDAEPTFREELDRCADVLKQYLSRDIRDLMFAPGADGAESELNQTRFAQPALFAFEYALARTWMSWGVQPSAMIGHSIGEYVAACLGGVMSLDDALRLVAERGRLMQAMPAGRMLAIPLSEAEVTPVLGGELSLAAVNAPRLSVVAGPSEAIATLERRLGAQGIECRALHTSHAFHSAMMDPAIPPFLDALGGVELRAPVIPFISNLTGTLATANEITQPDYWARHLRGTVRFADGLRELARTPGLILLEVGPGKALSTLARQTIGQSGAAVVNSVRHPLDEQPDFDVALTALGQLWSAGVEIDWNGFHRGERLQRVSLPTYPFERQRYMVDPKPVTNIASYVRPELKDCFYVPSWKRVPRAGDIGVTLPADGGAWLILVDEMGVGTRMAERVVAAGQPCFTVRPGAVYSVNGEQYTVRPGEREDYDQVIADVLARGVQIRRIVHTWSITAPDREVELDAALETGFFSLTSLMQALGDLHIANDPLTVTVMSNGLQQVLGHEVLSPAKALVLGPCRVIPHEFSSVSCRSVDIDMASANDHLIDELVLGAAVGTESGFFAYRAGNRWTETVERVPLGQRDGPPSRLRDRGVYLVTGGLGGIGLQVAKFLAGTVRARLVLTGRSQFPSREEWPEWIASHGDEDATSQSISAIQEIEAMGAEVLVVQGSVEVREDMERVVAATHDRFGMVNGAFHAAGVGSGALIQLLERDKALAVMAPKVAGALVLGSLFPESELDFLVLFSSIDAIASTAGNTSYAAANVFLDKYAISQRSSARMILSINWDAWQDVGMAAARAATSSAARANVPRITYAIRPEEGIEALRRALGTSVPQLAVITRWDLRELIEFSQKPKSVTDSHAEDTVQAREPALSHHARPELEQGFVAPRNDQERFIASVWEELLGLDRVGIDDNFFELGGHSLIATGLLARIHKEFQVKLPLRTIFEASTVRDLAERVSEMSWVSQPNNAQEGEEGREEFEI